MPGPGGRGSGPAAHRGPGPGAKAWGLWGPGPGCWGQGPGSGRRGFARMDQGKASFSERGTLMSCVFVGGKQRNGCRLQGINK